MKRLAVCGIALSFLAGCATSSQWSVKNDDRHENVVQVAYATSDMHNPPISLNHANLIATRQCELRGYSYTEKDVLVTQSCVSRNAAGTCSLWQVEQSYQCSGNWVRDPDPQLATTVGLRSPVPGP